MVQLLGMLDIAVKEKRKRAAWEFELEENLLASVGLVSGIGATFFSLAASDHYENIFEFRQEQ